MQYRSVCIALALVCVALEAGAAGIYKWRDAQGNIHYGERPPAAADAEAVKVPKTRASSGDAAARPEEQEEQDGDEAEPDADGPEEAQTPSAGEGTGTVPGTNCEIAKENLRILETAEQVMEKNAEGDPIPLDDEERQARLETARKHIDEYCN